MNKDGLVYSTNPNLDFSKQNSQDEDYIEKCTLSVCYEKKGRAGKGVTIIKGLGNSSLKLALLSQKLKKTLSIGGTVKNGEIILQGRFQEQVIKTLEEQGYKAKKVGGYRIWTSAACESCLRAWEAPRLASSSFRSQFVTCRRTSSSSTLLCT